MGGIPRQMSMHLLSFSLPRYDYTYKIIIITILQLTLLSVSSVAVRRREWGHGIALKLHALMSKHINPLFRIDVKNYFHFQQNHNGNLGHPPATQR